jgi:hypothetical protein
MQTIIKIKKKKWHTRTLGHKQKTKPENSWDGRRRWNTN